MNKQYIYFLKNYTENYFKQLSLVIIQFYYISTFFTFSLSYSLFVFSLKNEQILFNLIFCYLFILFLKLYL